MRDAVPVRRAVVSCYDKAGVAALAEGLHELDVELVSTGSTAATVRDAGVPVTEVADITGFPECLEGRVKTLHPKIHAGILADRSKPDHLRQLDELEVATVDLVVVNLYPFEKTVRAGAGDADVVEMIDIGGPTLLRAAAKNYAGVTVVVDPGDYDALIADLRDHGGTQLATRRRLAAKAFAHVARYDAAVAAWFHRDDTFPVHLLVPLVKQQDLRYGENPHQSAALYRPAQDPDCGFAGAEQLHGKELSYNNLVDADAAWALVQDLPATAAAIIKHTNPAGVAVADTAVAAYERALDGDPVSAFGGIVACNAPLDGATAVRIREVFTEVVLAPGFDDDALEALRTSPNLRVLRMDRKRTVATAMLARSIAGGVLVQDVDAGDEPFDDWRVASDAKPDAAMLADLRFAWIAAKHTKSNAVVLAKHGQLVGVGAGQMSRVDSVRLAVDKSRGRHRGAVLASDAFFPFRDGPDAAAEAGVTAIVQPGGSVRDDEVVAAADEHGLVMMMTGRRHFRH